MTQKHVALVYDRVNKWGGAERILTALHELYPQAPLYTSVYNPKTALWARDLVVRPSFLNKFGGGGHELMAWATPLGFETFDFSDFDIVISVTSADAKNIITRPDTLHICYCLTPTRYLWSGYLEYLQHPGLGFLNPLATSFLSSSVKTLRQWDKIAASRPDLYIAISETVKQRIETYYQRKVSAVIYPPVTIGYVPNKIRTENFYLTVSRLVGYKRVDLIILAFNRLQLPLVIIGNGWELANLKRMAGNTITFIEGNLTDTALLHYYSSCQAFVFAGCEDFGLVMAEAQAAGKPVIAYAEGGGGEIVQSGKTGILFREQTVEAIIAAVRQFQSVKINADRCRQNAERFSSASFKAGFVSFVEQKYFTFQKGNKVL
jgi:glycosyltransferase involved in cell wall biosynthesis